MPYSSQAQRRYFHTLTAKKAGIGPSIVKEYDSASKDAKLPDYVKPIASPRYNNLRKKLTKY